MIDQLDGKIIQIIPAGELYAVYRNKDGSTHENKVDVIALDDQGNIAPLDMDIYGTWAEPAGTSNFGRIDQYLEKIIRRLSSKAIEFYYLTGVLSCKKRLRKNAVYYSTETSQIPVISTTYDVLYRLCSKIVVFLEGRVFAQFLGVFRVYRGYYTTKPIFSSLLNIGWKTYCQKSILSPPQYSPKHRGKHWICSPVRHCQKPLKIKELCHA